MALRVLLLCISFVCIFGDPIIQLPNGKISGREATTFENKKFYAFEGIPYAAPPLGPLRFQAPQPAPAWEGILDTTSLNAICYQTITTDPRETEDCLYLNVYTPQLPDNNTKVSLPVMFFIYGGAFLGGFSQLYSPNYIVNNDVILVTINYRVGVFGFLSTEDDVIPGNAGLKDQHLGIRWTHQNIHLFGGDPSKITIFGESAGGASTSYQLLNQNNNGLIAGAIHQSGTFLSTWSLARNARENAFGTAANIDVIFKYSNNSENLRDFLQSVDADSLDVAARQYYQSLSLDLQSVGQTIYAPVIEAKNPDAFLTKKMYSLLREGNFVKVPVLVGMTSEEALYFYQNADIVKLLVQYFDYNLAGLVPVDMKIDGLLDRFRMGRNIAEIYGGTPLFERLGDAIRLFSDDTFTRSIIKYAEFSSKFAPTYFYEFSYDGEIGRLNTRYKGAGNVGHVADLYYLFCLGYDCNPNYLNDEDRETQNRFAKLWTNFAKYKNPTPESSDLLQNVTWLPVSNENFNYLDFGKNLEIKENPRRDTYSKWVALYDSLGTDDFDTY